MKGKAAPRVACLGCGLKRVVHAGICYSCAAKADKRGDYDEFMTRERVRRALAFFEGESTMATGLKKNGALKRGYRFAKGGRVVKAKTATKGRKSPGKRRGRSTKRKSAISSATARKIIAMLRRSAKR